VLEAAPPLRSHPTHAARVKGRALAGVTDDDRNRAMHLFVKGLCLGSPTGTDEAHHLFLSVTPEPFDSAPAHQPPLKAEGSPPHVRARRAQPTRSPASFATYFSPSRLKASPERDIHKHACTMCVHSQNEQ
jgi:hypothetical protein